MNWNNFDHNFCEGSMLSMPEYLNSFSTLIMVFHGLLGLLNTNDILLKLINITFIITGIGSFLYHWFGTYGFALLDEIPMIIIIFLSLIKIELLIKNNRWVDLKIFIYLLSMICLIINNTIESQRLLFPLYFGLIFTLLIYKIKLLTNLEIINKGLYVMAISGIIWIITEISCKYVKSYIFLIGHPLWHIGMSYGYYKIINSIEKFDKKIN